MPLAELGELESPVKEVASSRMSEMKRARISEQEWEVFLRVADRLEIDVRGLLERDVRFPEMEGAGHEGGRKIAQAITERLSLARAERLSGTQPCPTCGKRCPVDHQERDQSRVFDHDEQFTFRRGSPA